VTLPAHSACTDGDRAVLGVTTGPPAAVNMSAAHLWQFSDTITKYGLHESFSGALCIYAQAGALLMPCVRSSDSVPVVCVSYMGCAKQHRQKLKRFSQYR
jgi:hypothetical protein